MKQEIETENNRKKVSRGKDVEFTVVVTRLRDPKEKIYLLITRKKVREEQTEREILPALLIFIYI